MNNNSFINILLGVILLIISACGEVNYVDVGSSLEYIDMVGTKYTVISPVNAFGIRKHSNASVDYITIIPPPGIDGAQIGFKIPIAIGEIFTIETVYESNRIFDSSISFGVNIDGSSVPKNLPIRIELMRGNQGLTRLSLNPSIFRKM
jgi:hypothetical protein